MRRSPAAFAPMSGRLFVVLSVAVLSIVTMAENSATRQFLWPWFFFAEGLFLLPILWLAGGAAAWTRLPSFGKTLDLGLIGLAVTALVAAIFSPYRWLSLVFAAPYVALVALAYGVSSWLAQHPAQRDGREYKLSLLLGLPIALVAIASFGHWIIFDALPAWSRAGWSAGIPRNQYPFGHSTYTAGFTVLSLPWLTYLAVHARNRARAFWIFATLCGIFIIPSTSSRGGVLGVAVMLGCVILLFLLRPDVSKWHRRLVLVGASLAIILFVAFNPRLRDLVMTGRWNAGSEASNLQRSAMFEAGIQMGRDRVIVGYGPGTVPLVYPHYRSKLSSGVENVLQLHNTPVQLWAEMGALGLLFSGLVLIGIAQNVVRTWRVSKNEPVIAAAASVFAGIGLMGYAAFAITDYQLDLPAFVAVIACYIAILAPREKQPADSSVPSRSKRAMAMGSAGLVTILLLSAAIPFGRGRRLSTHAAEALEQGDKRRFVELNTKAAEILRRDPVPINQIGAVLIEERTNTPDEAVRAALAPNILQCFTESLRRSAAQEYVHFNLGWLLLELGQPGAADHFRAAAQLVPDKGGVYLGLSLALQRDGYNEEASTALALECLNDPRFLASPWWQLPAIANQQLATAHRLDSFYKQLSTHRSTGPELLAELNYQRSLAKWLMGLGSASDVAAACTTQAQKDFFLGKPDPKHFAASPLRSYRRERTAYPVLMRAPEMRPPRDLYQVQENQLAETELAFLFPPKGWLAAPLWAHFRRETFTLAR